MSRFASYDGATLAFRALGDGEPLVCLSGGPGLSPDYLADLGGLGRSRRLLLLESRGTGASDAPADPAAYRCDALVRDVEAFRAHLGLERMDLLGHSAAADLAVLYAAAHPRRVGRLLLITPVTFALGLSLTEAEFADSMARRSGEPWYPDARAAVLAVDREGDTVGKRLAYAPLFYGRWDEAARAHSAVEFAGRAPAAEAGFYADGAFNPDRTRAELSRLSTPVLVYVGGLDVNPTAELGARAVRLFPRGELAVQPGAGHVPWLDDPVAFCAAVEGFLR